MNKLVTLVIVKLVSAYPEYQQQIPNGGLIKNPCNTTERWLGLGHELIAGQGPLNPFGRDFLVARKRWTLELCRKDSDGDGRTNGEELGDGECRWQVGQANPTSSQLSHPGICEPVESELCRANETTYMCQYFDVPADKDYHIIAWEMLIDNQEMLHHMTLATCNSPQEVSALSQSGKYKVPEICPMTNVTCLNLGMVWAFGQPNRCYSNTSGILMGPSSFKRLVLQLHYNNPSNKAGLMDSSGIRFYYTPNIRPQHSAMFQVGQLDFAIPPRQQAYKVTAVPFTTPQCSANLFGRERFHLSSMLFHMHQLGSHARFVIRKSNGTVITLVDEDVTYDRPKFAVWESAEEAPFLEAGDNMELECTFTTVDKNRYTWFGEATSDEMCLLFIEIFPRPQNRSSHPFHNIGPINFCSMGNPPSLPTNGLPLPPALNGSLPAFPPNGLQNGSMPALPPNEVPTRGLPTLAQLPELGDCNVAKFGLALGIATLTPGTSLFENCGSAPGNHEYPVLQCRNQCRLLVERLNWTDEACITSPAFRAMTAMRFLPSFEEAYKIQSHLETCQRVILGAKNAATAFNSKMMALFASFLPFV